MGVLPPIGTKRNSLPPLKIPSRLEPIKNTLPKSNKPKKPKKQKKKGDGKKQLDEKEAKKRALAAKRRKEGPPKGMTYCENDSDEDTDIFSNSEIFGELEDLPELPLDEKLSATIEEEGKQTVDCDNNQGANVVKKNSLQTTGPTVIHVKSSEEFVIAKMDGSDPGIEDMIPGQKDVVDFRKSSQAEEEVCGSAQYEPLTFPGKISVEDMLKRQPTQSSLKKISSYSLSKGSSVNLHNRRKSVSFSDIPQIKEVERWIITAVHIFDERFDGTPEEEESEKSSSLTESTTERELAEEANEKHSSSKVTEIMALLDGNLQNDQELADDLDFIFTD